MLAASLTAVNVSQAGPNTLTPGAFIAPLGLGPGPSAGATLLYTTNASWGPSMSFEGVLTSRVYANDANNPYGGLTFTYSLSISASSTNGIAELALGGWAGFNNIDVTGIAATNGYSPNAVGRSAASIDNGDDVNFFFFSEMGPGTNALVLDIETGAPYAVNTLASVIDHSSVPNIESLGPSTVPPGIIPEPASVELMSVCLAGLATWTICSRRRKNEI